MFYIMLKIHSGSHPILLSKSMRSQCKIFKKSVSNSKWVFESFFYYFWSHLGRFWGSFGSKMGGVLVSDLVKEAFPPPSSTPNPFWPHPGTISGPFWNHFGTILGQFWEYFLIKFLNRRYLLTCTSTSPAPRFQSQPIVTQFGSGTPARSGA